MISVCMATYNGENFIKEQIDSILPQLSDDDEIVISDDGSTDKTVDIIENYGDSRIKLLKYNSFRSTIYNLENALKDSKGDVIFLCDQDDKWNEDKVNICLERGPTGYTPCEIRLFETALRAMLRYTKRSRSNLRVSRLCKHRLAYA